MLIHLKIFACIENTHSISFYLLLCDVTYNHGKTVPYRTQGIFGQGDLSRFLEFKVGKDNCNAGAWPAASHKRTVYWFSPKSHLYFPLKTLPSCTMHSLSVTLTYLCSRSCARRGGWSRCSNTKHWSTAHKFNLTCWSANAGQNNWTKSVHFEAAATKITAERGGREGGSFPATKMRPSLAAEACVCRRAPRGCAGRFWSGGRLTALNLSALSQLAFSPDPEREERGPCLIRRDDNLHPSQ